MKRTTKLLTALTLTTAATMAHADNVSLIADAYSQHHINGEDNSLFNSRHNMKGVIINDKYVLATFENSYYNRSNLIAYNWQVAEYQVTEKISFKGSAVVGLVTGYSKDQVGAAYLGNDLSVYFVPTVTTEYKLSEDLSLALDFGVIPADNGAVTTQTLRLKFSF